MMISVIIPCYNASATIGSTVESALTQDVEREVIVIDDGSTDGSRDIIASFGDRIRGDCGPNRGASAARERGSQLARGELFQYLDSDDQLAPGTLACRLETLRKTGADAVYTDWQKLIEMPDGSVVPGETISPDGALLDVDAEAVCADSRFWVPPAAILYRQALVKRIGGWRSNLRIVQDARFLFDAAAQNAKFAHAPGVGALYRVRSNSLSRRSRAAFVHDCLQNVQEIEAYWTRQNTLTPQRLETLRSMWRHAATAALIDGTPDFEVARKKYNGLVEGRRFAFEAGWLLRKLLGAERAGAIARSRLRGPRMNERLSQTSA
jgi:glycosyltransferase involved in cell wall biosynthesis